ncbi:MAG: TetR/AcrR family transcriptional regulator [Candidatus Heteroscillospira sp.]|jgi:AcrR family transcriptional regulator
MQRKKGRNTKKKIVSAAWRLFYEQGYDSTTIEDIVEESGTSRGSFYHYFEGKDALLGTLSEVFDEKYEELLGELDGEMNSFDKLLYLNQELFTMIENTISLDLLARLYSTQLVTSADKHLLDHNRVYYRVIRHIAAEGQQRGQISDSMTANEIAKIYALCERALLYDWCLCGGEYSLKNYAKRMMPMFLGSFRV